MSALPDDFVEDVRQQADASRSASAARWVDALGPSATSLVAVPTWTDRLAASLGVDPEGDLVDRLWRNGQVERRTGSAGPGGSTTFWMTDAARAAWSRAIGYVAVEDLGALAARIRDADPATVPDATALWARLVGDTGTDIETGGGRILDEVRELVLDDDLVAAAATIDAADGLAAVLGGTWPSVVDRARRLLHLGYRRRHDRALLDDFVEREAELGAISALLRGDDDAWALHLRGPGGVGKTMLVRYLASEAFRSGWRDGDEVTLARVDFDHMSADYPSRRPVQLLEKLLDELLLHSFTGVAERRAQEFGRAADQVHAAAASGDLPFDDPLVTDAIGRFGAFCRELPAPVVLVLDTCEELAKLHPVSAAVPAVECTFAILEAVHSACPSLRVLLSGRRYLARAGRGWEVPPGAASHSVTSLAARPYLGMYDIGGFTGDEAVAYLRTGLALDESTVRSRLASAPDAAADDRYNPFLLSLYRVWWEQEGSAALDDLALSAADAYVEQRIVARLRDAELLDLLPAIALLGRFDADLLGDVRGAPIEGEVLDRLAGQEWLTYESADGRSGPRFVVEEVLRKLLERWADHPSRKSQTDRTARRMAGALCRRMVEEPLAELTAEAVVGALRLATPVEAASAWAELEDRIGCEARWEWAANIVARVRGDLDESLDPLVDAAVRATEIAVAARRNPYADQLPAWDEVGRLARLAGPDAGALGERLVERAQLGALRYSTEDAERLLGQHAADLLRRGWVGASAAATLEALIGRVPVAAWPQLRIVFRRDMRPDPRSEDPVVVASAGASLLVLVVRAPSSWVRGLADRAAAAVPRTWADWPERDGRDPVVWNALVEAGVCPDPSKNDLDRWADIARSAAPSLETDRLLGAVLRLRQRDGPLGMGALGELRETDRYIAPPPRRPHVLYDDLPPVFVELARAYFRAGRPVVARRILEDRRQEALTAKHEDRTIRQADVELVWLALRMRWQGFEPSLVRQLSDGPDARGRSLARAFRIVVEGETIAPEPVQVDQPHDVHRYEVDAVLEPPDDRGTLVSVASALEQSDPITSLQLVTSAALTASEPQRSVLADRVQALYRRVAAMALLPEWGSIALKPDLADPWAGWRARWAALDGSLAVAPPSNPELARWFGPAQTRPRRRRGRQLVRAAGAVAAVVAGALLVYALAQAGTLVRYAVVGAGFALVALIARLEQSWRVIDIHAVVGDDPEEDRGRVVRVHVRSRSIGAFRGARDTRFSQGIEVVDGVPRLAPLFPGVAQGTLPRPAMLEIVADDDQALAWEAAIVDPRVGDAWRYAWLRTVRVARVRTDWPRGGVTVSAPAEWARLLQGAYGSLVGELFYLERTVESVGAGRIHHAIGTAIGTRHGALFEESSYDPDSGRAASQRGALGRDAPFVVLQDSPVDGPLVDAPRSSAIVRQAAFDLARDTGATVVCLPALPPGLALDVLSVLARMARRRRRPNDVALARIVVAMKERIRAWGGEAEVDPRLVAQQIVVFRPSH